MSIHAASGGEIHLQLLGGVTFAHSCPRAVLRAAEAYTCPEGFGSWSGARPVAPAQEGLGHDEHEHA